MNILYLTNHLNIGGISSYVLTLVKGLKSKGHNIYIASCGGELLSNFIQQGAVYTPIPINTKSEISPKIIFSLFKLSGLIRQKSIDVVHSNSRTTGVLACLLGELTNTAHIHTCHGFFKRRLSRRLFGCWGERVIAISEEVKEHLMRDFDVDEKDIRVIHNGIDIKKFTVYSSQFTADLKKKFGLGEGPIIGIVGRLSDVKGHIYLIEAMKLVLEKIPNAQLLIVGEGKMKKQLKNLVQKLKLEKSVNFVPSVGDTAQMLSIMDLFVMPSLKEGLGLSLMEAMAQAKAVIGSDVGGIRSLVQDGYNGLLVRPADSQLLFQAIIELLRHPEKAKVLGNNARIFIEQNFSAKQMVSNTQEVYLECLSAKS